MKYRRGALILLVTCISFLTGGWFLQRGQGENADVYQKARMFDQIVRYVAEFYVDSIGASDLYDMAIEGMFDQLGDPYTSFLRREAYGELSLSTTGNYGGVGLQIDSRDGWITVVTPIADSPAERAGLLSGDQIVEVEGRSTREWSTQQAANVLRGEPGTQVKIAVLRAGLSDSLRFTLTRDRIHVNSVEGAMLVAPSIGYLRLTTVSASSAAELKEAVAGLRDEGARALVLDLRNNPGGVLDQGVALADLFLDRRAVVVETRGRAPGASRTYRAEAGDNFPNMPIVVLVNEGTASAAEIVSGALQDHKRAVILGSQTFGKGVAYLLIRLTDTEAVTVTSSRWYTPNGRSIQRSWDGVHAAQVAAMLGDSADAGDPDRERGGIHPDIVVRADTLTDGEQRFAKVLGAKIPEYRNVLTRYALDLKGRNGVTDPEFPVTGEMLNAIREQLEASGIEVADSVWTGARDLVAQQFSYELTRYAFGRDAELRRRAAEDSRTQRAITLLQAARTPEELIQVVARMN